MEHFVFRLLADADRSPTAFYEKEARQRQILSIPPFARLVLVRVEGANRTASFQHARELADKLRAQTNSQQDGIRIFGPTAAPISKMVGRWRFQIVIRGFRSSEFRTWLQSSIPNTVRPKSAVRVSIDVDPRSLL